MASVPVRRAGLGSAINNAISRVGAPLASALLFIAITRDLRAGSRGRRAGPRRGHGRRRWGSCPLAPPPPGTPPDLAAAITAASTDAFHLAMVVAAALLVAGAVVNLVGLERGRAGGMAADEVPPATGGEPPVVVQ